MIKDSLIGLKELRENTEKYISQINKGRSFVIMRRSKPIFRMIPVDDYGDTGVWELLLDFTKLAKKGVNAKEVIKSIKRLNAQNR